MVRKVDLLDWMKGSHFVVVPVKQRPIMMKTNLEVNSLVNL